MDLNHNLFAALGFVVGVLAKQLADEIRAWIPWFAKRALNVAIRYLPISEQLRFREEWTSHFEEVPGEIGKLVFALGLISASLVITRNLKQQRLKQEVLTGTKFRKSSRVHGILSRVITIFRRKRRPLIMPAPETPFVILSNRERECFTWACRGKTRSETAEILAISDRTVEFHFQNAMRKLRVHNKFHAIAIAIHMGLITP